MLSSSPSDVVSGTTPPQSDIISTTTEGNPAEKNPLKVQQQPTEFLAIRSGPISCPSCSFKFCYNAKKNLERHLKAGKCKFCDKIFKCHGALGQHLRKNVRCSQLLNPKMKKKSGGSSTECKKYVYCEMCNKSFRSLSALKIHQTQSCNGALEEFKCEHCEKSFERIKSLTNHQITWKCNNCDSHHACTGLYSKHKKVCQVEQQTECGNDSTTNSSNRPKCEFCNSFFKSSDFHFGESKICKKCGLDSPCTKLSRQHEIQCNAIPVVEKFYYQCVTCKQWLKNKGALKRHQRLRVCDECKLQTFCAKHFRDHDEPDAEAAQHATMQPKLVLRRFHSSSNSLLAKPTTVNKKTSPEKTKSKNVWKFQCPSCSQKLSCNTALKKHVRSRTCKICKLKTACFWKYRKHMMKECKRDEEPAPQQIEMQIIEQIPPASPSQICPFCGENCKTEEVLEWHARPTRCPRCTYRQPCTTLMAKHLNVCRFCEEKVPFACPICEKTFSSAALLGTHVQLECGTKFWCHDCDKVFFVRVQLDQHNARFHPAPCENINIPSRGMLDMIINQELRS